MVTTWSYLKKRFVEKQNSVLQKSILSFLNLRITYRRNHRKFSVKMAFLNLVWNLWKTYQVVCFKKNCKSESNIHKNAYWTNFSDPLDSYFQLHIPVNYEKCLNYFMSSFKLLETNVLWFEGTISWLVCKRLTY